VLALALAACLLVGAAAAEAAATPRAQALRALRKAFPTRVAAPFRSLDTSQTRLVQKLTSHEAIVADATGRNSLAVGVLPLFGRTPAGQSAPVDLGLIVRGGSWVPGSALVPVSLPTTSVGPVRFTGQPWAVRFASGQPIKGSRMNGSLLFANVGGRSRATDVLLSAIPSGAKISFVLPGPASLGPKRLQFALPAGWRLAASRQLSATVQLSSRSGQAAGLIGPMVATDSHGRRIALQILVPKRGQLLIAARPGEGSVTYPVIVSVPVARMGVGSWLGSPVAWQAVTSAQHPFLSHRSYGEYGVWYGATRQSYLASTWGAYGAAAPAGAYIYKLTEGDVTHTPNASEEYGGIYRAGNAGWESRGTWSGPDGSGVGAYRAEQRALSNATYTYCARASCAPDPSIGAGNRALFGLRMLGPTAPSMRPAALIDNATLYLSDNGPVSLSTPAHSGYTPGTWVRNATDTVSATASEAGGLGIYHEIVTGAGTSPGTTLGPTCTNTAPPPCPLSFTGRMTYSTVGMAAGTHTLSVRAVDAGGTASPPASWTVSIDRKAPTLTLSGPLAAQNQKTVSPGQYGLTIGAEDTDGPTPTSGIAQISVLVDGKAQSGVSGFAPCSFGAQCSSSATANWTLATTRFSQGAHTIVVKAVDSAGNVATSTTAVSLKAAPVAPALPKMYWGASIGNQFTGSAPPYDWNAETDFANLDAGGKQPSIVSWGQPFNASSYCTSSAPYPTGHYCPFPTTVFDSVRQHGYIPMLSWSSNNTGNYWDANYMDGAIASGSQDAYIRQWARAAKAWGHPFFLRFDWEMNGNWFNWGTAVHTSTGAGNATPAQFVAMWRHVHDIFTSVGATNVTWVWCANQEYPGGSPLASNYPGASYVDWTCLDAYNSNNPWKSPETLFGKTYSDIAALGAKPMMIGETASTTTGGSKPHWLSDFLSALGGAALPKVVAFVWEDINAVGPGGYSDWPIEGSNPKSPDTASTSAFTAGIKNSRYTTNTYSQLNTSPIPAP
jgi:hypothetical protein